MLLSGPPRSLPPAMLPREKGWETQFLTRRPHAQWRLRLEKRERPSGWPTNGPPGTLTPWVQTLATMCNLTSLSWTSRCFLKVDLGFIFSCPLIKKIWTVL